MTYPTSPLPVGTPEAHEATETHEASVAPGTPEAPGTPKRKILIRVAIGSGILAVFFSGLVAIFAIFGDDTSAPQRSADSAASQEETGPAPASPPSALPVTTLPPTSAIVPLGQPPAVPPPPPQPPAPLAPKNDPRYGSCKEATDHGLGPYRRGVDPEYSWYGDTDDNGVVCER